jgi:hypothetical protein
LLRQVRERPAAGPNSPEFSRSGHEQQKNWAQSKLPQLRIASKLKMYNGAAAIKILPVVATKRPLSLARCREKLSVSSDGTTGVSESTPGVSGAMAQTLSRPPGGICETSGAIRFVELHCGLGDRIWEEGNSDIRQLT